MVDGAELLPPIKSSIGARAVKFAGAHGSWLLSSMTKRFSKKISLKNFVLLLFPKVQKSSKKFKKIQKKFKNAWCTELFPIRKSSKKSKKNSKKFN